MSACVDSIIVANCTGLPGALPTGNSVQESLKVGPLWSVWFCLEKMSPLG